jgi:hypothetical protein
MAGEVEMRLFSKTHRRKWGEGIQSDNQLSSISNLQSSKIHTKAQHHNQKKLKHLQKSLILN